MFLKLILITKTCMVSISKQLVISTRNMIQSKTEMIQGGMNGVFIIILSILYVSQIINFSFHFLHAIILCLFFIQLFLICWSLILYKMFNSVLSNFLLYFVNRNPNPIQKTKDTHIRNRLSMRLPVSLSLYFYNFILMCTYVLTLIRNSHV